MSAVAVEPVYTFDEWSRRCPNDTWLYFIQAGSGPVKIGVARNPIERIATLQTAHYERLRILGCMWSSRSYEGHLHRRFAAHRVSGEWFAPVPEIIASAAAIDPTDFALAFPEHADRELLATLREIEASDDE